MGCWNETCLISNLPIMCGETVGAVILARKSFNVGASYPDDVWAPITPVIMGSYDGYGRISVFQHWKEDANDGEFELSTLETALNAAGARFTMTIDGKIEPVEVGKAIAASKTGTLELSYDKWDGRVCRAKDLTTVYIKEPLLNFIYECTKNDVGEEYKKLIGIPLNAGQNHTHHPVLAELHRMGISVESTLRVERWLRDTRNQWHPTAGTGSQRTVEDPETVQFYELMATLAQELYWDYESSENN